MPETTTTTADKPRYVSYPVEPDLFDGLGIDPAEAGVRDIRSALEGLYGLTKAAKPLGIAEPIQIAGALTRYANAIGEARRSLGRKFDRAEWNIMADVMNGCLDLQDYSESVLSMKLMVAANVEDGHRLNGAGHSHFDGDADAVDARVVALLKKIQGLTTIEADAIGVAIREFWAHPGIDHLTEEWWLPDRGRKGKRKARTEADDAG
jgi:hypothetical protein